MASRYHAYLAANIRRHRRRCGWTQAQLAEQAGLDADYMIAIERVKANPSLAKIVAIAEALDTTPGQLLRRASLPERKPGRPPRGKR